LGLGCYSDVVIPFSTLSAPKELPEELQHKDGIISEKDVQLLMKDREIEELKQTHLQMLKHRDEEMERHDAIIRGVSAKETTLIQEIKRLRHELNGVEVLDVDMGVSEVVERDDTDLPAKRVRLEQAVTASVSQALQERLVEVKKEKANVLAGMSDALECPICMEKNSDTALSCGHCFCSACAAKLDVCATCSKAVERRIPLYGAVQTLSDMLMPT